MKNAIIFCITALSLLLIGGQFADVAIAKVKAEDDYVGVNYSCSHLRASPNASPWSYHICKEREIKKQIKEHLLWGLHIQEL